MGDSRDFVDGPVFVDPEADDFEGVVVLIEEPDCVLGVLLLDVGRGGVAGAIVVSDDGEADGIVFDQ